MPRASESAARVNRPRPRQIAYQSLFTLLIIGGMLPMAGCDMLAAVTSTPQPMATSAPTPVPSPTLQILTSQELYADDSRHIGETSPRYASFPAGAVLPPVPMVDSARGVTVAVEADTVVAGELYDLAAERQPGVLIIGADVAAWGDLPLKLARQGLVVLVLQTGPLTPARHIQTMMQSLIAIPTVDAGSIGLIGEARAADLAALSCATNTLCDVLALFSPLARDSLLNMLPSFGERPLWLAAAKGDSESYQAATALANAAQGTTQFVEVSAGRGAALLTVEPALANQLVDWFTTQLLIE